MEEILNSQIETLKITDFLKASEKYINKNFTQFELSEIFKNSLTGNIGEIFSFSFFEKMFFSEVYVDLEIVVNLLIIIIIHSVFKCIVENFSNYSFSQILYFIQYLLITTVLIDSFISIVEIARNSINDITNFMNLLIPILLTLVLTTGNFATATIVQPILLFMISFIGNIINIFIIPVILVTVSLSIVSNLSEKIQINKISKFLKSSIIWFLGIILTIFTSTLSIEGTLSSSVDGLTSKTAKAVVSNFIPVVGKIMGDSVETIIGCTNILKNSIGIIGVIIIICIVIMPIIKVCVLMLSLKITSAVCEIVADSKIVNLIENVSDAYKLILAILISVAIMFVIGVTLVVKISNVSVMYR